MSSLAFHQCAYRCDIVTYIPNHTDKALNSKRSVGNQRLLNQELICRCLASSYVVRPFLLLIIYFSLFELDLSLISNFSSIVTYVAVPLLSRTFHSLNVYK